MDDSIFKKQALDALEAKIYENEHFEGVVRDPEKMRKVEKFTSLFPEFVQLLTTEYVTPQVTSYNAEDSTERDWVCSVRINSNAFIFADPKRISLLGQLASLCDVVSFGAVLGDEEEYTGMTGITFIVHNLWANKSDPSAN